MFFFIGGDVSFAVGGPAYSTQSYRVQSLFLPSKTPNLHSEWVVSQQKFVSIFVFFSGGCGCGWVAAEVVSVAIGLPASRIGYFDLPHPWGKVCPKVGNACAIHHAVWGTHGGCWIFMDLHGPPRSTDSTKSAVWNSANGMPGFPGFPGWPRRRDTERRVF